MQPRRRLARVDNLLRIIRLSTSCSHWCQVLKESLDNPFNIQLCLVSGWSSFPASSEEKNTGRKERLWRTHRNAKISRNKIQDDIFNAIFNPGLSIACNALGFIFCVLSGSAWSSKISRFTIIQHFGPSSITIRHKSVIWTRFEAAVIVLLVSRWNRTVLASKDCKPWKSIKPFSGGWGRARWKTKVALPTARNTGHVEGVSSVGEASKSVGRFSSLLQIGKDAFYTGKLSSFYSHIKFLLRKFCMITSFATVYRRIVPKNSVMDKTSTFRNSSNYRQFEAVCRSLSF